MNKQRKQLRIICVLLAVALSLSFAACSSSVTYDTAVSSSAADSGFSNMQKSMAAEAPAADMYMMDEEMGFDDYDYEYEEPMDPFENPATGGGGDAYDLQVQEQKLVKYVTLSLESKEFDETLEQLIKMVSDLGGYVQNQSVDGSSLYYKDSYYERYAYISARIPSDKLDTATAQVGDLCNVVSRNESVDNISDMYYDTQAHLEMLTIQEERLLEILKQADKLEDIITLEGALTEVRYQIESMTASMKRMDNQVSYSYLSMDLREVIEYQDVRQQPKTFIDEISASFSRSGNNLLYWAKGAVFFIIEDGPILLLNLLILFILFLVIRKIWRWLKKKGKFAGFFKKSSNVSEQDIKPTDDSTPQI